VSQEQFIPLRRPADAANVRAATVNFGWLFSRETLFSSVQAMALSSIMQRVAPKSKGGAPWKVLNDRQTTDAGSRRTELSELKPVNKRHITMEGAVNFRDLGGYPTIGGRTTRWRIMYRSDSLADLTAQDHVVLEGLGIRTLCDFRHPVETARYPDCLPMGHGMRVVPIGFLPEGALDMLAAINNGEFGPCDVERALLSQYRRYVTDHSVECQRVLQILLSEEGLPCLMHCASGKDRTGFAAAAVLLALGVRRDVIISDYVMTNDYRRDITHFFGNKVAKATLDTLTSANPRYIEAALDEIDSRFGSAAGWLESLGVGPHDRLRLLDLLTE
jgi:protein-tyrosine phosphatase